MGKSGKEVVKYVPAMEGSAAGKDENIETNKKISKRIKYMLHPDTYRIHVFRPVFHQVIETLESLQKPRRLQLRTDERIQSGDMLRLWPFVHAE
jgi:hypothetical protein